MMRGMAVLAAMALCLAPALAVDARMAEHMAHAPLRSNSAGGHALAHTALRRILHEHTKSHTQPVALASSLPLPFVPAASLLLAEGGTDAAAAAESSDFRAVAPDPLHSQPQQPHQRQNGDMIQQSAEAHNERRDTDASEASAPPHLSPSPTAIAGTTGISTVHRSDSDPASEPAATALLASVVASLRSVADSAAATTINAGSGSDPADSSAVSAEHHDSSSSSDDDDSTHWSLRLLRHATLCASLLLLLLGTVVWLWGHRLFLTSAPTCCLFMLGIWALQVGNCIVAAWTAESGMAKLTMVPLDENEQGIDSGGIDIATAKGLAAFAALMGGILGLAFLGWLLACSQPKRHALRVIALVWGTCLGSLLHISVVAWLIDTSDPLSIGWSMHASLLLCVLFCSLIALYHADRSEKAALLMSTAGVGAWAVIRGAVMLILIIEVGSASTASSDGVMMQGGSSLSSGASSSLTLEMDREWKWPNEWNPPLLDSAHPWRVLAYDLVSSDPSCASSLPYSSLSSSVTQDDIRLNVRLSFYSYVALMAVCFGVGVAVQGARQRRRMALNLAHFNQMMTGSGSALGSRRGSYKRLGSVPSSAGPAETSQLLPGGMKSMGARLFSEGAAFNGAAHHSRGGGGHGGYGSTSESRRSGGGRHSSDDLSTSHSRGRQSPPMHVPRNSRSVDVSPLRSVLVVKSATPVRNAGTGASGAGGGARSSGSGNSKPGRPTRSRSSFTLNINVSATDPSALAHASGFSRSPSAPALSAVEAEMMHVPYSVPAGGSSAGGGPPSVGSGGSGSAKGSLKKMRAAAMALKKKKKSLTFMDELSGLAVAPQRTPEPLSSDDLLRQAWPAHSHPRRLAVDQPAGSGNSSGDGPVFVSLSSIPARTPPTPAWSPYPLVTQQHMDEIDWHEQEQAAAAHKHKQAQEQARRHAHGHAEETNAAR